jgi:Protein of unknown function DUF104
MALKVDATFEDGVFVPARRPALADRERVRLTIEQCAATVVEGTGVSGVESPMGLGLRTHHNQALDLGFHPDGC